MNHFIVVVSLGIILLLAGCGNSPETQIYNHLEEAVQLEEGFKDQQDDITKLEQEEQELYKQIIELGIEELDQINELADKALGSIEERTEKINLEKESLDASRAEFEKSQQFIEEIKDEEIKEKAKAMYETMENRFEAYDNLNKAYNESLVLEKELYEMLKKEDLQQEELQAQIEKVNVKYQEVIEANSVFNEFTSKYNELKKSFYEIAEINVKYVE
ncbi:YkyA family protein [Ornithinibacillus sp. 179-J 7C1 HS]|uniref:YkyA family protein n=1 Tax=Ornithinibacillus sp. 179-J 7C1 HS TaxID=3142384 RepID=UPI0039A27947